MEGGGEETSGGEIRWNDRGLSVGLFLLLWKWKCRFSLFDSDIRPFYLIYLTGASIHARHTWQLLNLSTCWFKKTTSYCNLRNVTPNIWPVCFCNLIRTALTFYYYSSGKPLHFFWQLTVNKYDLILGPDYEFFFFCNYENKVRIRLPQEKSVCVNMWNVRKAFCEIMTWSRKE